MTTRYASTETNDNHLSSQHLTNVRSNVTTISNDAYKATQTVVNYVRNVTDSLLDLLSDLTLCEMCDFNTRNFQFMKRLMYLNANEIKLTLNALGTDAVYQGDSTQITSSLLQAPSYVDDRNYVENYAKSVSARENRGMDSTRASTLTNDNNYSNVNQLYKSTTNLFCADELTGSTDDDGKPKSGTFQNAWNVSDSLDSTLRKTRELFKRNKINTIISAFHTRETTPETLGDVRSKYGLSHGRNLLTKAAERNGGTYPINGYDDPYCRVWTHHHQYDRLDKLIRPFYVAENDDRSSAHVIKLKDFHQWKNFNTDEWGWKSKHNDGWNYSVLGDNGFVNIAPKYGGGGSLNVHPKQCMFSIENLAWQGFDPYQFEKALSWEQRGPMGGRIMWFPPYNLTFSESSSATWDRHTFIGRGEPVYTYTNTERRGTLSFSLVVDHPSILDYAIWDDKNHSKVSDTDILRFLAGCEEDTKDSARVNTVYDSDINNNIGAYGESVGDSGSLRDRANPTPLTDEYNMYQDNTTPVEAVPQETEPEEVAPETMALSFCVFYPNNYAGYYDPPTGPSESENKNTTGVEAMAYLLAGVGAQKTKNEDDTMEYPQDLPLTFENLGSDGNEDNEGNGYEMLSNSDNYEIDGFGVTGDVDTAKKEANNYIQGTSLAWYKLSTYDNGGVNKRWYYRIDGEYKYPSGTENQALNTYDQQLSLNLNKKGVSENYSDYRSYGLNQNAEEVKKNVSGIDTSSYGNTSFDTTVVSFAEVAYVLAPNDSVKSKIRENSINFSPENAELIEKILGDNAEYVIDHTTIVGVANTHGTNASKKVNVRRNELLAKNRAESVRLWLQSVCSKDLKLDETSQSFVDKAVGDDVSKEQPKVERRAEIRIFCTKVATTAVDESDQTTTTDLSYDIAMQEVGEQDGITTYINPNETDPEKKDCLWYRDPTTGEYRLLEDKDITDRSNYGKFRSNKVSNGVTALDASNQVNRYRYDQEYHFFKKLEKTDPIVFASLTKKLQYFSPAFHSLSAEGYATRLNFLQGCLRQGNTIGASDTNARTANNLAFGRPPVCVLRIGDFFNTRIIPENLSITYETNGGIQWDLNTEGAGVQPMIAHVSLSFYFVGGSDIRGAVSRLQNALSMNYYANSSLYDNRADRVSYNYSEMTNGAIDHELKPESSYFHDVPMQTSLS